MIRILQCVNSMDYAGLESIIMNYYRMVQPHNIQFDFLTHRNWIGKYDKEILGLGGRVYYAPRLYPQNYKKYFHFMTNFFLEHNEYQIVHSHIDSMSYLPLFAAKKAGIPIRIAHSHSTSFEKDWKYIPKLFFRSKLGTVANYFFACGNKAGEFLFPGKDFTIIPNAIMPDQFLYNPLIRKKIREELYISDDVLVLGHVGRFSNAKNHPFILRIFSEVLKIRKKSILLLIGSGKRETYIRKLAQRIGVWENIRFLGNRNDVGNYYQAMDVYLMPSFFEGVPVTGIEAQFSELPCLFSDQVPKEVKISDQVFFMPLKLTPEIWAERIIALSNQTNRGQQRNLMEKSVYNIRNSSKILESIYRGLSTQR